MARASRLGGRDFLLLSTGQAVSTLGSQACALAFPLLALSTTGSPALAGLLGFVAGLPALALQLPAGVLVDRADRRRVMIACDVARMGLMVGVVAAGWGGSLGFALLVATATAHAAVSMVFNLAQAAAVPSLLTPEELPRGIARHQSSLQATVLAGRPLGGWLFGLGPVLPFLANTVSYAVSLATLCGIRRDLRPSPQAEGAHRAAAPAARRSWRAEIGEGLAFVWAQPLLRALALLNATVTLLAGGFTLVVVVLLTDLGAPPAEIGLIFGACGAAGLVGSALTPRLLRRLGAGRVYALSLAASAAAAVALTGASAPWQAGLLAAVIVGLGPPAAVVLQVARARTIPRPLFARVRSVENTITASTAPLASLISGLVVARIGPAATCTLIGGGLLMVAVVSMALPSVRGMAGEDGTTADGPPVPRRPVLTPGPLGPRTSASRGRHRRPAGSGRVRVVRPGVAGTHRLVPGTRRGVTTARAATPDRR